VRFPNAVVQAMPSCALLNALRCGCLRKRAHEDNALRIAPRQVFTSQSSPPPVRLCVRKIGTLNHRGPLPRPGRPDLE